MSSLNNLKLYYFCPLLDSPIVGRGEPVRLLLEDAGIDYEYIRYSFEEWGKEKKSSLIAQGIPCPTLPYITIDGKYYGKTFPIMRFLSRKLKKYEANNEDDEQLLDAYTDIINDWVVTWVDVTFFDKNEEKKSEFRSKTCPEVFNTWDLILSKTKGPFILGDELSYADFGLFHMLEEIKHIKPSAETNPHLATFVEAFRSRPNLKKYLATDRA